MSIDETIRKSKLICATWNLWDVANLQIAKLIKLANSGHKFEQIKTGPTEIYLQFIDD